MFKFTICFEFGNIMFCRLYYLHWNELNIHCHTGTIGAVFDFFAGTVKRAPLDYRLLKEPKRMWKRYIIGNSLFLLNVMKEKKKGK